MNRCIYRKVRGAQVGALHGWNVSTRFKVRLGEPDLLFLGNSINTA